MSQEKWAVFGRWMAVSSGVIFIFGAFYQGEDFLSVLLRAWMFCVGVFFLYAAIRR